MGKGPRLLLVHGSVLNGEATWNAQRPLAERLELVVPNRCGFPPGPCVEALKLGRVSAAAEAVWLEQFLVPGTHLVGQSYGGVIALLAAARRPELVASLTVIEPPAFDIARGHPAVEAFVAAGEAISGDPESYLRGFLDLVGAPQPGHPLSPALLQGARMLMVERPPWEAEIPLEELAAARFPTLAVSGGHSAAFDAVCDILERRIGAERAVLPGAGHSPQRLGKPFNELLAAFIK
jgi:pimeloyl-ACP methyl ester carboxylesterase